MDARRCGPETSGTHGDTPQHKSVEEIEAWLDGIEDDPSVEVFDGTALRDIATARKRAALAEGELRSAVSVARAEGHSWAEIGVVLGEVSKQAAQQRFG